MILVTGGAGYIGSHVIKQLLKLNYEVICVDNLSTGNEKAVQSNVVKYFGDLRDETFLSNVFNKHEIRAVIHFAASCYVGESVHNPLKYYENNLISTISLLKQMNDYGVKKIVLSSTCAVYGEPKCQLIDESLPTIPINPYGKTKLTIERMIQDLADIGQLEYIFLRYFNVAGADPEGDLGEFHQPETHLIPNILLHLLGKSESVIVNGKNYNTPDGTCIRDFIHVTDLGNAHIFAVKALLNSEISNDIFNVGLGKGYSVQEVIKKCEELTGKAAKVQYRPRRVGDPPRLVASNKKIEKMLNWKATYSLEDMIYSAYSWFKKHPNGYLKNKEV